MANNIIAQKITKAELWLREARHCRCGKWFTMLVCSLWCQRCSCNLSMHVKSSAFIAWSNIRNSKANTAQWARVMFKGGVHLFTPFQCRRTENEISIQRQALTKHHATRKFQSLSFPALVNKIRWQERPQWRRTQGQERQLMATPHLLLGTHGAEKSRTAPQSHCDSILFGHPWRKSRLGKGCLLRNAGHKREFGRIDVSCGLATFEGSSFRNLCRGSKPRKQFPKIWTFMHMPKQNHKNNI